MATAEPAPAWWKLTFLRKKKSEAKELYEVPPEYSNNAETAPGMSSTTGTPDDSQFNARLERIVDKTATKGRHVKVSNSGRFKEKKRIRSTLAENPELFPNQDTCSGNQSTGNWRLGRQSVNLEFIQIHMQINFRQFLNAGFI